MASLNLKASDVMIFSGLAAVGAYYLWSHKPNAALLSELELAPVNAAHPRHITCSGTSCDGLAKWTFCPDCPQQYPFGPTNCGCSSLGGTNPTRYDF